MTRPPLPAPKTCRPARAGPGADPRRKAYDEEGWTPTPFAELPHYLCALRNGPGTARAKGGPPPGWPRPGRGPLRRHARGKGRCAKRTGGVVVLLMASASARRHHTPWEPGSLL